MEENKKISMGDFLVYALFFVLIFGVFMSDLLNFNAGSEEEMKDKSQILGQATSKIDKVFEKLKKPDRDVIKGRDGWLFYRPYMEGLKNDIINFKALEEISSMKAVLADKGIKLIVVPVPLKVQLHSDKLAKVDSALNSYKQYIYEMETLGIDVVDLSELLAFDDSYLKTDTHWSALAVSRVSEVLSSKITGRAIGTDVKTMFKNNIEANTVEDSLFLSLKKNMHVGRGNLSKSLDELIFSSQILDDQRNLYKSSSEGEILILGDSFSNVFSDESLGWSEGAGLAEKMAFNLKQNVDKIAVNNGGASGSRNLLMEELSTGYNRLKNKKYVVWEFHYSEFGKENWSHFTFPEESEQNFLKVDKEMEVSGKVLSITSIDPNSVYKDQLASVRLKIGEKQVLFRAYGKKGGLLTDFAKVRAGDEVTVSLKPLNESLLKMARTEFSDLDLQLQSYCFGELKTNSFNFAKFRPYLALILLGIFCIRISRKSA